MIHAHPILPARRIAFVDPCSAQGYDPRSLETGGLGGTEATVLRIATALQEQFTITVCQNGRLRRERSQAGDLLPLQEVFRATSPDAIVVINRWKVALKLRQTHPDVPIFLWLHVYPGRHNHKMGAALKGAGICVICVSQSHVRAVTAFLQPSGVPDICAIYNPIADGLVPDDTPRDGNRLLFASSPHKGLKEVFAQFAALRETLPGLTLAIADPGYLRWDTGPAPDGIVSLGSLSHAALLHEMRRSLCLFYPQTTFAETFGLVLAEANAVGTPALVHGGLGANDEILSGPDQRVDGHDPAQILDRIARWQDTPPKLGANRAFRLSSVSGGWVNLLTTALAGRTLPLQSVVNE